MNKKYWDVAVTRLLFQALALQDASIKELNLCSNFSECNSALISPRFHTQCASSTTRPMRFSVYTAECSIFEIFNCSQYFLDLCM